MLAVMILCKTWLTPAPIEGFPILTEGVDASMQVSLA